MREKFILGIYVLLAALLLISCNNDSNRIETISPKEKVDSTKNAEKERDIERRGDEYKALCLIGKNKWVDFEHYYGYCSIEENDSVLNEELKEEGWYSLTSLRSTYWGLIREKERSEYCKTHNRHKYFTVLWNEYNVRLLYLLLCEGSVNTGTLNEFEQSLKNADDFIWYYDKAKKLGIVEDWETFVMLMFEPDCDYCECDREHVDE